MTERLWVQILSGAALFSLLFSFSVSLSIYQWCVLNQVPHRGAALLIFIEKNACLAVQLEAKQA